MLESAAADTASKAFLDIVSSSGARPDTLWHYTSASAVDAILESGSLFATHYQYVNDPSELSVFHQLAKEISESRLKNITPGPKGEPGPGDSQTYEYGLRVLWQIVGLQDLFKFNEPCVVCLSGAGDLLGQWRAYADNCKGYALGFNTKTLIDIGTADTEFRVMPVLYDPALQRKAISILFETLVEAGARELEGEPLTGGAVFSDWVYLIASLAGRFAPLMKHPEYADEREWRLIVDRPPFGMALDAHSDDISGVLLESLDGLDTRVARGGFVPYTEVCIRLAGHPHPLSAIRLGPLNDAEREKAAAKLRLHKAGLAEIEVLASAIPVRE